MAIAQRFVLTNASRANKTLKWFQKYFKIILLPERDWVTLVCRLSVACDVRAPYSGGWNFRQYFFAILYLSHPLISVQNVTEIVPGNTRSRALNARGVAKYSDVKFGYLISWWVYCFTSSHGLSRCGCWQRLVRLKSAPLISSGNAGVLLP